MRTAKFFPPFLKQVSLLAEKVNPAAFPFRHLSFLKGGEFRLTLKTPITFLIGENGSGKSTLIEAIAEAAGFPTLGGSQDHRIDSSAEDNALTKALRLSWLPKVSNGFFFRAESFFRLASYLDAAGNPDRHGGRELHQQSHGESFLAMFRDRLDSNERSFFLLDEPEVALSPTRQLAFLHILKQWQQSGNVQAVIVTHSPILMAFPEAEILSLDGDEINPIALEDTEHFRVTRRFLSDPDRAMRHLFGED